MYSCWKPFFFKDSDGSLMVKPWLKARGISGDGENRNLRKDSWSLPQAGCFGFRKWGKVLSLWLKHYRRWKNKLGMESPCAHIIMSVWVTGVHTVAHNQKVCLGNQMFAKLMGGYCSLEQLYRGPAGGYLETKEKLQGEQQANPHLSRERIWFGKIPFYILYAETSVQGKAEWVPTKW